MLAGKFDRLKYCIVCCGRFDWNVDICLYLQLQMYDMCDNNDEQMGVISIPEKCFRYELYFDFEIKHFIFLFFIVSCYTFCNRLCFSAAITEASLAFSFNRSRLHAISTFESNGMNIGQSFRPRYAEHAKNF